MYVQNVCFLSIELSIYTDMYNVYYTQLYSLTYTRTQIMEMYYTVIITCGHIRITYRIKPGSCTKYNTLSARNIQ